jgi:hypothetical protein
MSCSVTEDLGQAVFPRPTASPFRLCRPLRRVHALPLRCRNSGARSGGQRCSSSDCSLGLQGNEREITGRGYHNIRESHALTAPVLFFIGFAFDQLLDVSLAGSGRALWVHLRSAMARHADPTTQGISRSWIRL